MNDRELFELAAKAHGALRYVDGIGYIHDLGDGRSGAWWRPLEDDGDALRLAVAVGIDICFYEDCVETWKAGMPAFEIEPFNGDRAAATRRAIVRAAAELGRAL